MPMAWWLHSRNIYSLYLFITPGDTMQPCRTPFLIWVNSIVFLFIFHPLSGFLRDFFLICIFLFSLIINVKELGNLFLLNICRIFLFLFFFYSEAEEQSSSSTFKSETTFVNVIIIILMATCNKMCSGIWHELFCVHCIF